MLAALGVGQARALGEPGLFHDGEVGEPAFAVLGRRGEAGGVLAQAGPVKTRWPAVAVAPLGLQGAPEAEDGEVLGPEDEVAPQVVGPGRGCRRLLGEVREAGEADERAALAWAGRGFGGAGFGRRGGCCVVVIVRPIRAQFTGGQQARQPLQFPDFPFAPLACR